MVGMCHQFSLALYAGLIIMGALLGLNQRSYNMEQEKAVRKVIDEFWEQLDSPIKDAMYQFFCYLIYQKADFLRGVLDDQE